MVSANIFCFSPEPEISTQSITVPESVGDAEVCVRLDNAVENPFNIQYITSDGSAQSMFPFVILFLEICVCRCHCMNISISL